MKYIDAGKAYTLEELEGIWQTFKDDLKTEYATFEEFVDSYDIEYEDEDIDLVVLQHERECSFPETRTSGERIRGFLF